MRTTIFNLLLQNISRIDLLSLRQLPRIVSNMSAAPAGKASRSP